MTQGKKFKARVRARMEQTGESYQQAWKALGGVSHAAAVAMASENRRREAEQDAAIFAEYGAAVLGVEPSPAVALTLQARDQPMTPAKSGA